MKILFVSGLYPYSATDELHLNTKKAGLQNAANVFQWGVVEGLAANNADFEVVSFPFLPSFPHHYRQLYTPDSSILYKGKCVGRMLSYNNFLFFKDVSNKLRLKRYLKRWISDHYSDNEDIWIISYTPCKCFSEAIIPFKRKYSRVKYCAIIADLIDDATNATFSLSLPKLIQAKIEQRAVWSAYRYIDKYILLSKHMEEKINKARGRSLVVEGISAVVDDAPVLLKNGECKKILYTGSLQLFTGILDLIDAFKRTTNTNYRLVICGSGPLSSMISQLSSSDQRIEYLGNVQHRDVLILQRQADLLVNPRKPTVSLTRYSFPSKTIEYMASGTPMIGYKLDGIPAEYYPYMYIPEDLGTEDLANMLDMLLRQKPEVLQQFGTKAKEFIKKNKDASSQLRRVMRFLET